tara:strand:+ start:4448 stop:4993 length:546 start_codon:yes stop_codon:yes gene_type:complete
MLINKTLWRFFATATIFFWISLSAHAQLLMQPNISVAQAQKIIETIITECSIPGDLVTVTIAVVDRTGQPVMQVRADTASPHNWELAYRKAYTARTFRRNSIDWRDRTSDGSNLSGQRALNKVIPLGGGAPIMSGEIPVGAVGVSGAGIRFPELYQSAGTGQEADTVCAELGIAAIADDLE